MSVTVQIPVTGDYREIVLPAGYADYVRCLLVIGDYLYLCTATTPAKLLKVRKDTFSLNWTVDFPNDSEHKDAIDAVYSSITDRIYVVFANSPPTLFMIAEVNPNSGSNTAPTITNANFVREEDIAPGRASMATDNSNLYVLTWGVDPTRVVHVRLSDAQVTLGPQLTGSHPYGWVIKYDGGKLYAYGKTEAEFGDTWVKRINPLPPPATNGLQVENSTVITNGTDFSIMAEDMGVSSGHLWVGRRGNPTVAGIIKKVDRNSFIVSDFATGINGPARIVRNAGSYVWGLYDNGKAVRINTATDTKAIYTLNDGQGFQSQIGTDADAFLYTAWNQSGTKIARYRIPPDAVSGWPARFGGTGDEPSCVIAIDTNGNILLAGNYKGSDSNFGGSNLPSSVLPNLSVVQALVVAKYSSDGTHLWSNGFVGNADIFMNGACTDSNGNLYVVGRFSGSANFGGQTFTSTGSTNAFIVKYSSTGQHLWSNRFGGALDANFYGVVIDSNGNVLAVGQFSGTINFGGGNINAGSTSSLRICLARFTPDGAAGLTSHLWSARVPASGFSQPYSIAATSSGDIFIGGYFSNAIDFDPAEETAFLTGQHPPHELVQYGGSTVFLVKYTTPANSIDPLAYGWSKRIGGNNATDSRAVSVDNNGNVTLTGVFQTMIDLSGGTISTTGFALFLSKYTNAGTYLWSEKMGLNFSGGINTVAYDSNNNILVGGTFSGNLVVGGQTYSTPATSDANGFVVKYLPGSIGVPGTVQRVVMLGNTSGCQTIVRSIVFPMIAGVLRGTGSFSIGTLTALGGYDVFIDRNTLA